MSWQLHRSPNLQPGVAWSLLWGAPAAVVVSACSRLVRFLDDWLTIWYMSGSARVCKIPHSRVQREGKHQGRQWLAPCRMQHSTYAALDTAVACTVLCPETTFKISTFDPLLGSVSSFILSSFNASAEARGGCMYSQLPEAALARADKPLQRLSMSLTIGSPMPTMIPQCLAGDCTAQSQQHPPTDRHNPHSWKAEDHLDRLGP